MSIREQLFEFVVPAFAVIGVAYWLKITTVYVANKVIDVVAWSRGRRTAQ